jgi:Predicted P-loop ATPase fused to an acetyltransferase
VDDNLKTPIRYRIVQADNEQMEWIFVKHWGDPIARKAAKERLNIIFVAVDENENIIGRLSIVEKPIPAPMSGIGWWIANINTYDEYRRKGIATAMVNEVKKLAESAGIHYLWGMAEPTKHASMFWYKNNFSMQKCGAKCDDENDAEKHGNYQHIMFYRTDKEKRDITIKQKPYRIDRADTAQLDWIYNEYVRNDSPQRAEFYEANKTDFFGYIAVDENGETAGIITALADELGSPLVGTVWAVSYIFVRPNLRRQGIGSALINEIARAARGVKIEQVLFLAIDEQASAFLYANNLDIFFWKHLSDQNRIISAGLRIV